MGYFDRGGALHRRLGDAYCPRPKQIQLAQQISALKPGDTLFAQAPTATGKTDALAIGILESGHRGVLSTYSRAELAQIQNSVPEWQAAFPHKRIKVMLGRDNYVCVSKRESISPRSSAYRNSVGLRVIPPEAEKDVLSMAPHRCAGKKCPDYSECYYYEDRAECFDADLVICTHKMVLVMCDWPSKDPITGALRYWFPRGIWVLDEGDCIHAAVVEELSIGGRKWQALIDDPGVSDDLKEQIIKLQSFAAQRCTAPYFTSNLDPKAFAPWAAATLEIANAAQNNYVKCTTTLQQQIDIGQSDADVAAALGTGEELPPALETMRAITALCSDLLLAPPQHGFGMEYRPARRCDKEFLPLTVRRAPVSIGEAFKRAAEVFHRVALVSGSMALPGSGFSFTKRMIGVEPTIELELASPLDHAANLRVAIEHCGHDRQKFCKLALRLHRELGPVLILASSYTTIQALIEHFDDNGLGEQLLVQERGSHATASHMADRMRGGGYSLAGTTSCMRGLDLDARYKNCVLIEKLPPVFAGQDLVCHGYELQNKWTAYRRYKLPTAHKLAIQAAGRALRREGDQALLVLADRALDVEGVAPGCQYVSLHEGINWMRERSKISTSPQITDVPVDETDWSDFLREIDIEL